MSEVVSNHSVDDLRDVVELLDGLAQEGLEEINAIASLALAYMENPNSYNHTENLAHALIAIRGRAQMTMSCINSEAEGVGCNHVNQANRRRVLARSKFEGVML